MMEDASGKRPLIIGHRGAKGLAPENTLPAFRAGIDAGADGVEFDVQRTVDGHLVVFHDDDLKRLAGVDGRIVKSTLRCCVSWTLAAMPGRSMRTQDPPGAWQQSDPPTGPGHWR